MTQAKRAVAFLAAGAIAVAAVASAADAAAPAPWQNCTAVNKKYPHGVGKSGARDHTSAEPVTNFKHSTALYNTAMKYNKGLDRDKDSIACEQL